MKKVVLTRPLRKAESYVKKPTQAAGVADRGVVPPYGGNNHPPSTGKPLGAEDQEKSQVDSLLGLANALSATDRKELMARLALGEQSLDADKTRDADMWAQAVYAGLQDALGYEDGAVGGPALVKRTVSAQSAFKPVADFMRASSLDKLKVTERQSVYAMLAKLVIEKARYVASRSGAPLGPKLVATCSANLAGTFDQAFPGYLASGLAHLVAKRLTSSRD